MGTHVRLLIYRSQSRIVNGAGEWHLGKEDLREGQVKRVAGHKGLLERRTDAPAHGAATSKSSTNHIPVGMNFYLFSQRRSVLFFFEG